MKHTAAFVLLLTIAGTPATTLACVGRCVPDATPVTASCHFHESGAGARVTDTDDSCARLLVTSPFINENVRLTRTATPASIPYVLSGGRGEAQLVSVHDVAAAIPRRATSAVVLRL